MAPTFTLAVIAQMPPGDGATCRRWSVRGRDNTGLMVRLGEVVQTENSNFQVASTTSDPLVAGFDTLSAAAMSLIEAFNAHYLQENGTT